MEAHVPFFPIGAISIHHHRHRPPPSSLSSPHRWLVAFTTPLPLQSRECFTGEATTDASEDVTPIPTDSHDSQSLLSGTWLCLSLPSPNSHGLSSLGGMGMGMPKADKKFMKLSNSGIKREFAHLGRRDSMIFGLSSSIFMFFPSSGVFAATELVEDVKMASMVDDINAYSFMYPVELPSKKFAFKWVEENLFGMLSFHNFNNLMTIDYGRSYLACLFSNARQRIVSERVDIIDNLVISVSIDGEPYWYYEYLVRKSPTTSAQEPNIYRHYVAATAERDGKATLSKLRLYQLSKMSGSTPTKYVKGGCSQSTPSPKCMKTIFTKMEDKFDTLRVEVKELMKRFLASVDEEALMAVIFDDEPLTACYDIFRDAAKEMKKTFPAKEVVVISDNTESSVV
ncbi:hypothetical protein Syun_008910 [Stephania yunnanensis]|uniref:Uncharacterized protein n=1 Tax=Stephania yunnanensis TaxID=152371 RepID=A0AAP0KDG7_9MAGN